MNRVELPPCSYGLIVGNHPLLFDGIVSEVYGERQLEVLAVSMPRGEVALLPETGGTPVRRPVA